MELVAGGGIGGVAADGQELLQPDQVVAEGGAVWHGVVWWRRGRLQSGVLAQQPEHLVGQAAQWLLGVAQGKLCRGGAQQLGIDGADEAQLRAPGLFRDLQVSDDDVVGRRIESPGLLRSVVLLPRGCAEDEGGWLAARPCDEGAHLGVAVEKGVFGKE